MSEVRKQSVTGFRVVSYQVKRVKDSEVLKIVIEATVDDIGCGKFNMGDLQGAMLSHRVSDTDIGFSLFMSPKADEDEEIDF